MSDSRQLFDENRLPRMRETLKAEELNNEGCIRLAQEILSGAAEDYMQARRELLKNPTDKMAAEHFRICQRFYKSDYFEALSMGQIDGETAMKELDRLALGDREPEKGRTKL